MRRHLQRRAAQRVGQAISLLRNLQRAAPRVEQAISLLRNLRRAVQLAGLVTKHERIFFLSVAHYR